MKPSKVIFTALLLVAIVAGFRVLPLRAGFIELEGYVRSLGAVGPAVWALVYVVCTILLIPGSALSLGAAGLFGFGTGFLVVLVGANIGALGAFLLSRTLLRQKVASWAESNIKFKSLDRAIGSQGFKMVFLARLSPALPFTLLNYLLGLTAVRTGAYVLANLLGMLPGTLLYVYIGVAARDVIAGQAEGSAGFYQQLLKYLGLLATIAIVVLITRMARKALREAEQQEEGSVVAGRPLLDAQHRPTAYEEMTIPGDAGDMILVDNCHPPHWVNPTPAKKYNMVVIGGGTAGLVSAAGAAGLGAKVALIESNLLGGDCLNVGCVPSKGMIRAARAANDARGGAEFGIHHRGDPQIDFAAAMKRMRRLRAGISEHDSAERFRKLGVDVFIGNGRFIDADTIEVDSRRLRYDRAVIATGARAAEPPISGLGDAGYYTNETIFTLTELPRRLAVIGAGPIGCELSQSFQRFGSQVTLLTDGAEILPREDRDAAAIVRAQIEKDGVTIVTGAKIHSVGRRDGDKWLSLKIGDQRMELACDAILVAVGRVPNLEGLALDAAGVRYGMRGVDVDACLRTSNPRVYAAGDVCSRYQFTHAADAMARIVIANALFLSRRKVTDLVIPWCTYTDPEIAHVGYYERDAQAAGFNVVTLTQPLSEVDRAILDGEPDGFARVHYDKKSGRVLGGTIVARHAGEMLGELTLAITAKQKVSALSSTIHSYPTQAEALRKIGDAYMRAQLTPTVKKIFAKWLEWRR